VNYPRRLQYRRLRRAGLAVVGSATAALLAFSAVSGGEASLGGLLVPSSALTFNTIEPYGLT